MSAPLDVRFCPSCAMDVEVAEGRCWECCHVFGYPVVVESDGSAQAAARARRSEQPTTKEAAAHG